MPITRAWEFVAGVLVALVSRRSKSTFLLVFLGFIGLLSVVVSALAMGAVQNFPGYVALFPVVGSMLIIHGARAENALGKLLTVPGAGWIGDRSYGWYLWHWPAIQFVKPF